MAATKMAVDMSGLDVEKWIIRFGVVGRFE